MNKYILTISDMDCVHCAEKVENTLKDGENTAVWVDLDKRQATVMTAADTEGLIAAVTLAGFSVSAVEIA